MVVRGPCDCLFASYRSGQYLDSNRNNYCLFCGEMFIELSIEYKTDKMMQAVSRIKLLASHQLIKICSKSNCQLKKHPQINYVQCLSNRWHLKFTGFTSFLYEIHTMMNSPQQQKRTVFLFTKHMSRLQWTVCFNSRFQQTIFMQ